MRQILEELEEDKKKKVQAFLNLTAEMEAENEKKLILAAYMMEYV